MLYKKNPSLAGKQVSLPVVTSALTHGLSMAGYRYSGGRVKGEKHREELNPDFLFKMKERGSWNIPTFWWSGRSRSASLP
jgi:hypothetical protein